MMLTELCQLNFLPILFLEFLLLCRREPTLSPAEEFNRDSIQFREIGPVSSLLRQRRILVLFIARKSKVEGTD